MESNSIDLVDDDIVDVDEAFCGWQTPHRFHFGVDLLEGTPIMICPGYEGEIVDG